MKTNADVPFGEFQINESTPFYSSDKENRESYGPHPRLVLNQFMGIMMKQQKAKGVLLGFMVGDRKGMK
jgi:hypothetical protein